jgi:hypothetical protein
LVLVQRWLSGNLKIANNIEVVIKNTVWACLKGCLVDSTNFKRIAGFIPGEKLQGGKVLTTFALNSYVLLR